MAVVGGNKEIALLARQGSNRGDIGIDQGAYPQLLLTKLQEPCGVERRISKLAKRDIIPDPARRPAVAVAGTR